MATNNALITDALRLLGVIGETESPSGEQGAHALGRLNRMMEQWTENDISLGWFEQSVTTDDAPIPKWAELGVVSKLAQNLHATYPSASLAPWVHDDSQNGYGTIARRCMLDRMKPASLAHLPQGEGSGPRSARIETDGI